MVELRRWLRVLRRRRKEELVRMVRIGGSWKGGSLGVGRGAWWMGLMREWGYVGLDIWGDAKVVGETCDAEDYVRGWWGGRVRVMYCEAIPCSKLGGSHTLWWVVSLSRRQATYEELDGCRIRACLGFYTKAKMTKQSPAVFIA